MGTTTTTKGYYRQCGNSASNAATPSPLVAMLQITFDAAQVNTTLTGKVLPKGAFVMQAYVASGVVGGTSPQIDVGIPGTEDGWISGQQVTASSSINLTNLGSLADYFPTTEDLAITAGDDGTGTPGVGDVTVHLQYVIVDDGRFNN